MTDANILEIILNSAKSKPAEEVVLTLVLSDGQIDLTAADLVRGIADYAQGARDIGIAAGDRVFLLPAHNVETVLAFLGLICLGAVPCIFPYPTSRMDYIAELANDLTSETGAKWLVTTFDFGRASDASFGNLQYACLNPIAGNGGDVRAASRNDTAYLQLTSGTTGRSRAIEVPHAAVVHNVSASAERNLLTADDVFVGWLPLNHDMGLVAHVLLPLMKGNKTVLISPNHWLRNPKILLEKVAEHRGTITHMPNFGFGYIARRVSEEDAARLDLRKWRRIINGAETVRPETIDAFQRLVTFGGIDRPVVAPGYGLGENVLIVASHPSGNSPRVKWISASELDASGFVIPLEKGEPDAIPVVGCGPPIRGVDISIRDDAGETLGECRAGEIVICGKSLCTRYLTDPPEPIQSSGGFATGDIGFLDKGEIFICGRKKEIAIVAGRNINVNTVAALAERQLGRIARRSAAFSVFSPEIGTEEVVLVCEVTRRVPDDEAASLAARIRNAVQDSLQISIADILFKTNSWLPKTTSGKTNISKARRKYLAFRERRPRPTANIATTEDIGVTVSRLAASKANRETVDPDKNLFDEGMDSLSAVELLIEIEHSFGVRIPKVFFENPTVTNLVAAIRSARVDRLQSEAEHATAHKTGPKPAASKKKARRKGAFERFLLYGPSRTMFPVAYETAVPVHKTLVRACRTLKFFSKELEHLRYWHREIDSNEPIDSAIRRSLLANTWIDWRDDTLARCTPVSTMIRYSGCPDWLADSERRQGVIILLPHALRIYRTLHRFLEKATGREVAALVGDMPADDLPAANQAGIHSRASQLWTGRSVLLRGGTYIVAGDGVWGERFIEAPFFSRRVRFRVGAAELAVSTGARILPVFPHIDASGSIQVRFGEELRGGSAERATLVREITERYAQAYAREFPTMFMSMRLAKLKHLARGN